MRPLGALLLRSAAQARFVLIGAGVLLCGFQLIIVGQAAEIQRSQNFGRLAELMPAFLQRGLGSRAMLLATFRGTVAFGYFHPVVCLVVACAAIYVATEPAHEIESGLVDLELARSMPRHLVITRSLVAMLLAIAGATVLMFAGTSLGMRLFDAAEMDVPSVAMRGRLLLNLAATASCFAAFALFVAAGSRRWSTAFTTGVLTAVVLYLLDFLAIGWPSVRAVAWISPFHYFPALSVVAGDSPLLRDVSILLGGAALFSGLAYRRFGRRDL
jgi:ABC-type transport system involved in multi-copper enzyme maturation permease subunit